MASTAEQLAANISFGTFAKAKVLKQRLLFTVLALLVYRLGTFVPIPGVDPSVIAALFAQHATGILGIFDTFAGGGLSRMSIFALNIFPYISASIIIQLMTAVSPQLDALKKEGELGRRTLNQYTRYLTVLLAGLQAWAIASGLQSEIIKMGEASLISPLLFKISTLFSLVGGTLFLMWLGEQITARGIGNGISLLIFAGIVANLPAALGNLFELGRTGQLAGWAILLMLIAAILVVAFIVYMERAQRRILIQHPKRQMGNRIYGGDSTHMPIKLNVSGVIPPIFASSLLLLPITILRLQGGNSEVEWVNTVVALLGHGQPLYMAMYAALIIFFAFFYTSVVFNVGETAENLRKSGGFIPGVRPGTATAMYFDAIVTRLTLVGALYLTVVCLLPEILMANYQIPFYFGGTSLLIVVTVTIDTVGQIHGHLLAQQYEGLMKKAKLKGF
jgi:preprotein translocase subunit SecY